eukprot:Rhum_TRINITY_DN14409_c20_g1::Rhum_TRINITY_DN14409_c20_g1_i1::g.88457::m.88457/K15175/CDC73; parafibromin
MGAVGVDTEAAYKEWVAYLDNHFSHDRERSAEDKFPTLRELKVGTQPVLKDVPKASLAFLSTVSGDDETSVPVITIGESFRSKRSKIHEFNYQKMGQQIPTVRDSFFKDQDALIVGRRGGGGGGNDAASEAYSAATSGFGSVIGSASQASAASGFGSGSQHSGVRRGVKRAREASGSPSLGHHSASQRSVSLAPNEPPLGPVLSHHSESTSFNHLAMRASHYHHLVKKSGDGAVDPALLEKASKIVAHVRKKRFATFANEAYYGFDVIRKEFRPDASGRQVARALRRVTQALEAQVPRPLFNSADVRPIIIVPAVVQSAINIHNAARFLGESSWVDPMQAKKQRTGEALMDMSIMKVNRANCPFKEFLIMDTPEKIEKDKWPFVCCVFVSGQTWQFQNFWGKDAVEPRDVLSKLAGFNLQYDDEELHSNVTKWNVMSLRVSKTMNRRHKDIKTVEDFWRALLLRMPFQERFRSYFKE